MQRAVLVMLALSSCDDSAPAVIVEINSDLDIPRETNSLVARVQSDGRTIAEETYALGDAPRDGWPQTLPVIAGATYDGTVRIAAEARISQTGPSVVVGFGEIEVMFPRSGSETVRLEVPRSCIDSDSDGYGLGFGCKRVDCDDTDPRVPGEKLCPGFEPPDAGPRDAGDAGEPGDAGPMEAGPDTGMMTGELCGEIFCAESEACFGVQCYQRCTTNEDCGSLTLGCLELVNICFCRAPCPNGTEDCGPFECIDGCCDI